MWLSRCTESVAGAASRLLILGVRLYQYALRPLLGGQCRFVPSCSQYFVEAVRRRGALRGLLMGLWRLLRCNPLCKGGYDPVEQAEQDSRTV